MNDWSDDQLQKLPGLNSVKLDHGKPSNGHEYYLGAISLDDIGVSQSAFIPGFKARFLSMALTATRQTKWSAHEVEPRLENDVWTSWGVTFPVEVDDMKAGFLHSGLTDGSLPAAYYMIDQPEKT